MSGLSSCSAGLPNSNPTCTAAGPPAQTTQAASDANIDASRSTTLPSSTALYSVSANSPPASGFAANITATPCAVAVHTPERQLGGTGPPAVDTQLKTPIRVSPAVAQWVTPPATAVEMPVDGPSPLSSFLKKLSQAPSTSSPTDMLGYALSMALNSPQKVNSPVKITSKRVIRIVFRRHSPAHASCRDAKNVTRHHASTYLGCLEVVLNNREKALMFFGEL